MSRLPIYLRWALLGDDGRLYPLYNDTERPLTNEPALCCVSDHAVPAARCRCGYYATTDLWTLLGAARWLVQDRQVLLHVWPHGHCIEDAHGIVRSQYQQIVGVFRPACSDAPVPGVPVYDEDAETFLRRYLPASLKQEHVYPFVWLRLLADAIVVYRRLVRNAKKEGVFEVRNRHATATTIREWAESCKKGVLVG